ncbi:hypothetical protein [Natronococcus jeotgali]|uniref:hypothetical protein n=1 Tax=Natronococcus jeotgali TaxID=413812 RepID=UPI0012686D3C|nr:hypothetical protein [Natronococcus jeotgali]
MDSDQTHRLEPLQKRIEKQYRRLEKRLEDYEEEDILERKNVGDNLGDIQTTEHYLLKPNDANELLSFYITTAAAIESESALIINAYSFNFGLDREGSLDFLYNLRQKDREDMIYYLGLIDSGLKGELAKVRKRRNEFAHSQDHRIIDDIETEKANIKRAYNAMEKLKEISIEVEMKSI